MYTRPNPHSVVKFAVRSVYFKANFSAIKIVRINFRTLCFEELFMLKAFGMLGLFLV